MKGSIVISLWAILNCAHLHTNGQPRSSKEAKSVAEQMNEHLRLTPAQHQRVLQINIAAAKKMKLAKKKSNTELMRKKAKMSILDEMDLALMEILSSRQWEEWISLSQYIFEKGPDRKK